MRAKHLTRLVIAFILTLAAVGFGSAQTSEEAAGQAAEQAGKLREAVTHYTAALQTAAEGSDQDQRLREKIIRLVLQLNPPPAVPDEVIRYEGRAEAALKSATKQDDFMDAAKEYRKALSAAPWVASYYFNLGVVLEKASQPTEAIRQFKLYLLAAPAAQDATDVRKKIAGLEYEVEKAAKNRTEAQEEERKRIEEERRLAQEAANLERLSGVYRDSERVGFGTSRYRVTIVGNKIDFIVTEIFVQGGWATATYSGRASYQGAINGNNLSGTCRVGDSGRDGVVKISERSFTGTINPAATTIQVSCSRTIWNEAYPPRWMDISFELTLRKE